MSIGFNFKSPAELIFKKKVSLSFETLKQGIDFSSPAMEVLDTYRYLPTEGCFVYIENLLFSIGAFINGLTETFWVICCNFYVSICCFTSCFYVSEAACFLKSHEPTFASFKLYFCSFLKAKISHLA